MKEEQPPPEQPLERRTNRSNSGRTKRKSVCWGSLTFYVFPNILGDNPAVSDGAPLTIGWKHESKSQLAIDYYEFLRDSRPRRRRKDLLIPSTLRDT